MTPLQRIAMGLVIVFLTARFAGWDALSDPVGWALVLAGAVPVRSSLRQGGSLVALAAIAGAASVPLAVPGVDARLSPSGQWAVGIPQTVFCLVLCVSLAALADDTRTETSGTAIGTRLGVLRTAYVVVLVLPVLVYGGGVDVLAVPMAVVSVLANLALVYYAFRLSSGLTPSSGEHR